MKNNHVTASINEHLGASRRKPAVNDNITITSFHSVIKGSHPASVTTLLHNVTSSSTSPWKEASSPTNSDTPGAHWGCSAAVSVKFSEQPDLSWYFNRIRLLKLSSKDDYFCALEVQPLRRLKVKLLRPAIFLKITGIRQM